MEVLFYQTHSFSPNWKSYQKYILLKSNYQSALLLQPQSRHDVENPKGETGWIPNFKELWERRASDMNNYNKAWVAYLWEENGTDPLSKCSSTPGPMAGWTEHQQDVSLNFLPWTHTLGSAQSSTAIHSSPIHRPLTFFKSMKHIKT